jgi:hypothetical protein
LTRLRKQRCRATPTRRVDLRSRLHACQRRHHCALAPGACTPAHARTKKARRSCTGSHTLRRRNCRTQTNRRRAPATERRAARASATRLCAPLANLSSRSSPAVRSLAGMLLCVVLRAPSETHAALALPHRWRRTTCRLSSLEVASCRSVPPEATEATRAGAGAGTRTP